MAGIFGAFFGKGQVPSVGGNMKNPMTPVIQSPAISLRTQFQFPTGPSRSALLKPLSSEQQFQYDIHTFSPPITPDWGDICRSTGTLTVDATTGQSVRLIDEGGIGIVKNIGDGVPYTGIRLRSINLDTGAITTASATRDYVESVRGQRKQPIIQWRDDNNVVELKTPEWMNLFKSMLRDLAKVSMPDETLGQDPNNRGFEISWGVAAGSRLSPTIIKNELIALIRNLAASAYEMNSHMPQSTLLTLLARDPQ